MDIDTDPNTNTDTDTNIDTDTDAHDDESTMYCTTLYIYIYITKLYYCAFTARRCCPAGDTHTHKNIQKHVFIFCKYIEIYFNIVRSTHVVAALHVIHTYTHT